MLKFEWNELRIGDQVLVHDPHSSDMTPLPGVVAMINTQKGQNGVGVVAPARGGGNAVVWPARLAVHRALRDPTEPCWRCETLTELPGRHPAPSAEKSEFGLDHKFNASRRSA
jgi:hypothetical protein